MKTLLKKTWFQMVLGGLVIGVILIVADTKLNFFNRDKKPEKYNGSIEVNSNETYFTKIEFSEIKFDFGKVKEGDTVMHEFKIKNTGQNLEELELELIDYGLEEIGEDSEGNIIIRTAFNEFGHMAKALEEKKIEVVTAELTRIPVNTTELDEEAAQDVFKLVDKLEQDEDVQKVFHNMG